MPLSLTQMNKQQLVEYCTEQSIPVTAAPGRRNGQPAMEDYVACIKSHWGPESYCQRLAKQHGHRIILTPPGYSEWQVIELEWAMAKNHVGRNYTKVGAWANMQVQLAAGFSKCTPQFWSDCEGHVLRLIRAAYEEDRVAGRLGDDALEAPEVPLSKRPKKS